MSAPVDVLAVLSDLAADMGDTPGTTGHQIAQVRAAVAELIEAASDIRINSGAIELGRLAAALARAGGAP